MIGENKTPIRITENAKNKPKEANQTKPKPKQHGFQ